MKAVDKSANERSCGHRPQDRLNNMFFGSPKVIKESKRITSDYFRYSGIAGSEVEYKIEIQEYVCDIESWLENLIRRAGWKNIEEALRKLPLPESRMMAFPGKRNRTTRDSPQSVALNAIILSKCNDSMYSPGSPMIFTRKRMTRCIKLIDINLNKFYELD